MSSMVVGQRSRAGRVQNSVYGSSSVVSASVADCQRTCPRLRKKTDSAEGQRLQVG